MRCPFCSHEDTQVVDTRSNPESNVIRRRRRCPGCDKRFTTYEKVELRLPRLVKKDGTRTDYDRDKLVGSMMLALRKRSVATEAVDTAADRIEERLRALGERETSTSRVGAATAFRRWCASTTSSIEISSTMTSPAFRGFERSCSKPPSPGL